MPTIYAIQTDTIPTNLFRPTNVGFGISYILPVIVACLSGIHKLIIIENPEAHLHPKGQAKMGSGYYEIPLIAGTDDDEHGKHTVDGNDQILHIAHLTTHMIAH